MKSKIATFPPLATWIALSSSTMAIAMILWVVLDSYDTSTVVQNASKQIVGVMHRPMGWAIIEHVITVLILFAMWQVAHEFFLAREARKALDLELERNKVELLSGFKKSLIEQSELTTRASEVGIVSIHRKSADSDKSALIYISSLISSSSSLTVVFGSGRRWISKYEAELKDRLSDPSKTTCVFCVHPDSPIIQVNAEKLRKQRAIDSALNYQLQILSSVRELKEFNTCGKGLTIFGHKLVDSHFICIGDSGGVFIPKFFLTESRYAPAFQLQHGGENSFVSRLQEDIAALEIESSRL